MRSLRYKRYFIINTCVTVNSLPLPVGTSFRMIQEVQSFRKFFDQIRRGESDIDHLWFYNIYKMMP